MPVPGSLVKITEMAADALPDVVGLCQRELILDRYAESIPAILARRPHVGLIAKQDSEMLGCCIGSVGQYAGHSVNAAQADDDQVDGFIDLLVVDGAEQRRGIGSRLATAMERQLAARGCTRINLAGNAPFYAWPGVDIHYTAAVCLADDLGYQRHQSWVNMDVELRGAELDTSSAATRLRSAGIQIHRASAVDAGPIQESLRPAWWPTWVSEIVAALRGTNSGVHVAVRDGRYLGFCAYGVNRPHEVGPIGTLPEARRLGIGTVLLKRCLAEQRDRGVAPAELVWVGPLSYFSSAVNATIGRAFWQYEKDLAASDRAPNWRDRIGLL
jgi:mycothiol synthase